MWRTSLLLILVLMFISASDTIAERKISVAELRDRIMGGWVGQGVGVTFADIYEFKSLGKIIEGDLRPWSPEMLENSLDQDDLYVDMTFIAALEKHGPDITYEQAGVAFGKTEYRLWHANRVARDNIRKGIMPPLSGHPRYNLCADDIDFQIEADGIGLVCPGLPQSSNDLCEIFGSIMAYGDGKYGGMWVAAMYTQAFFETDIKKIVTEALKAIPAESLYSQCINDVIRWHEQYPDDWRKTWHEVEAKWNTDVNCRPGNPFNICAKLNGAYIAIALLYGNGDIARTKELATRCGQDTDCNASNAVGVLGAMVGLSGMDEKYKSHLPNLAGKKFSYTDYCYDTVGDACVRIAKQMIERAGGRIVMEDGEEYAYIPIQEPIPPLTFEQWPIESKKRALGIE